MRILFIILLCVYKGLSQNIPKDTLYFYLDADYIVEGKILSPDERQLFVPDDYDEVQQKIIKSNALGYFIFWKDTTFQRSIPVKPLNLHKFIEKKENYYPGKYNRIINQVKLRREFFYKNEIFFVSNNEIIKPRHLTYRSYYPIRISKGNNITNPNKDSLYFAFNEDEFYDPYNRPSLFKTSFGIVLSSSEDGIQLEKIDSVQLNKTVKPLSILEYKSYLESRVHEFGVRSTENFAEFLGNYRVFLFKDQVIYEVCPRYWIE